MAWAGKYRGRGKGGIGFSNRSKADNGGILPPTLYPPFAHNPLPLNNDEEAQYLFKFKRENREWYQNSQYYLKSKEDKKDIDRYSDKYNTSNATSWQPDFSRLPDELKIIVSKDKSKARKKLNKNNPLDFSQILMKLETAEEVNDDDDEEAQDTVPKKKTTEEGEEVEEEEDEEEEEEEENFEEEAGDYGENYFEDDDNNGNNSDDNEATF